MNQKANLEIIQYLRGSKNKIDVKSGACRYNQRCQYNSVHEAIEKSEDKVAMCMCVNEDYTMIHFVNVDSEGVFTDNTLGHWSKEYEYFFIKYIDSVDFFNIDDVFVSYRKELRKKLSFWTRLLSSVEF
jgi:hypothetical protein